MKATYVAFDTETGGLDADKSLLSVYFMILDENLNQLDELLLLVKPTDGVYHVTTGALGVNKIDLVLHDKKATTYDKAAEIVAKFLADHSANGKSKLTPIGHNVPFDIGFIQAHLVNRKLWETFVSYRLLDTATVGMFLRTAGLIPKTVTGSLGSYAEHYKVTKETAHTADGDVKMTVEILACMLDQVNLANVE